MLANAFLREFTTDSIPSAFSDEDAATRYPWNPCPSGTLPSDGNYCWIDYRDESMMSSELCTYDGSSSGNAGGGGASDETSPGSITGHDLAAILRAIIGLFLLF